MIHAPSIHYVAILPELIFLGASFALLLAAGLNRKVLSATTGAVLTTNGSANVPTSANQLPALSPGDKVQFRSQQGVTYTIAPLGVTPTAIVLTAPYTGTTANKAAFKVQPAPVTRATIYSTALADTNGVATAPAIPPGSGARKPGASSSAGGAHESGSPRSTTPPLSPPLRRGRISGVIRTCR